MYQKCHWNILNNDTEQYKVWKMAAYRIDTEKHKLHLLLHYTFLEDFSNEKQTSIHFIPHNLNIQQEGWLSPTERASVSAISLRHILSSPGYVPGTIAVNVTWMERGFNAGQTHSSIYPSIFNRLRAMLARYWSEIATFFIPLAFNALVGVFPLEFRGKVWSSEN